MRHGSEKFAALCLSKRTLYERPAGLLRGMEVCLRTVSKLFHRAALLLTCRLHFKSAEGCFGVLVASGSDFAERSPRKGVQGSMGAMLGGSLVHPCRSYAKDRVPDVYRRCY